MDLSSLPLDVCQLFLDLRPWPLGVVQEVEQTVFLGFQLVESAVHTLFEAAEVTLLQEKGVVELAANGGLKVVLKPHCAEMHIYGGFDLGDSEVWQVAQVVLTASAQEVEVGAAVAFAGDEHKAVSTLVTPEQTLEPVVVTALAGTSAAAQGQDALNTVVGFLGDERLVPAGVLVALVLDEAAVVAVGQNLVELAERQRLRGCASGWSGAKSRGVDPFKGFFGGVLAAGEQVDAFDYEGASLRVNGDGADLAAFGLGFAHVEVAQGGWADRAAVLGLLPHLVLDVRAACFGLVLVDGVNDRFNHRAFRAFTHVEDGGDYARADLLEVTLSNPSVNTVPEDAVEVVDDYIVDVFLSLYPSDHLLELWTFLDIGR